MTVKELIKQLQQFNGELEVRVKGEDPTCWVYQNDIKGTFEGESNYEDEMEACEWDEDGDETDWKGMKVVLIDGGMF